MSTIRFTVIAKMDEIADWLALVMVPFSLNADGQFVEAVFCLVSISVADERVGAPSS